MSDKSNNSDPIERFFRQKADDYDIQYREEDWLQLESRLDEADRQLFNRRRRRLIAAAVFLLFAVLGYFTYEQQQTINQLSEQLNSSENITNLPDNFPLLLPETTAQGDDTESDLNNSIAKNGSNSESPSAPSSEQAVSESENETVKGSGTSVDTEEIQQNASTIFTESKQAVTIAKASPGFDGHAPAISAIKPVNIEQSQKREKVKSQGQPSGMGKSDGSLAQQRIPRFSFGVLIGPDMSTVGSLSTFDNPGHKIGFSLEYNITKNLAISTGAHRTNVRYKANGSEYNLPEGYLPYGTVPGEVAAQCILIDIPISLKYNFLHFNRSRVYATAGMSSYIMLDEDYRFNYEDNQPQLPERWNQRTGTRHWMSNATISVGYEKDLTRNISIRAEPFLKMPIKEVGWGNVNLYSMGSFISVNYKW